MCVETWIDRIESYVKQFEKGLLVEIAASSISETPYKKIRNIKDFKEKEDGFNEIKRQLRENYAINQMTCNEKSLTFSHLLNRVQIENESVSDFGYSLLEIAKIALPRVSLENIDDILKDQFIIGISNDKVKEKCTLKLNPHFARKIKT